MVHHTHRYEMAQALAGRSPEIPAPLRYWEFSLLMAGVELTGSGYVRPYRNTGAAITATWTRSGSTITVTTTGAHLLDDLSDVEITVSSDTGAVPLGTETATVTSATEFTFTGVATGGTSGTLTFTPPPFWDIDSTGSDEETTYHLLQAMAINFAAASGGSWTFDELRVHKKDAGGSWVMKFKTLAQVTIADGDTLVIPAGTLTVNDRSLELIL